MTDNALFGFGDEVIVFVVFLIIVVLASVSYFVKVILEQSNAVGENGQIQGRLRSSSHDCSICLSEATLAVETNCGHIFCGECIFTYYSMVNTGPLTAPTCPYCRQRITILLPYFSEPERNSAEVMIIETRTKLLEQIQAYNRRFSGEPRSIVEHIMDLPVLLRHLWNMIWSGSGLHIIFRLRILSYLCLAIIYILSPVDLVPEGAFGVLGFLDDILIFLLLMMYATFLFRNFVARNGMEA